MYIIGDYFSIHQNENTMDLIITILIGAIAGWLASLLVKGSGSGFIVNALLGILGSFVGSWIFDQLNINLRLESALLESVLVAAAGAMVVLFVAGLFRK